MSTKQQPEKVVYPAKFTSRKNSTDIHDAVGAEQESFFTWITQYQQLAVAGVRSAAVAHKIALHLERFRQFFLARYGHEQSATCLRRDVQAWQTTMRDDGLDPTTINTHLASLSAFTTGVQAQAQDRFALGDPAKGIRALGIPPLEWQQRKWRNSVETVPFQSKHVVAPRAWAEAEPRAPFEWYVHYIMKARAITGGTFQQQRNSEKHVLIAATALSLSILLPALS